MPSFTPTAAFYLVGMMSASLTFVFLWLRNFRETVRFARIGILFALVVIVADIVVLYQVGLQTVSGDIWLVISVDAMVAIRIYAFTVVGLLFASRLNAGHNAGVALESRPTQPSSYGVTAPTARTVVYALLAVVLLVLYSTVLFRLSGVEIGETFKAAKGMSLDVTPLGLLIVAGFGFGEEIFFRLGLQNSLSYWWRSSRYGDHLAILGTTLFWCAGHVGVLDPDWVKFAQIFVLGLTLGYMNRRFGVIPCMIIHVVFNIVMAVFTPMIFGDALVASQ